MNSNFESSDNNMNNHQWDRFELLSAYLDGEVTAQERRQVEEWLVEDPEMQALHQRLLKMNQSLQYMPIPPSSISAEQLSNQVFESIERRRWKRFAIIGGGAIAAVFLGTMSLFFSEGNSSVLQFAQERNSEPLMVALDEPVVPIPEELMIK